MSHTKQRGLFVLQILACVLACQTGLAFTTDVATIRAHATNQAAQLHLSPADIASSMTLHSSNQTAESTFLLIASNGQDAIQFHYQAATQAVLKSASLRAPSGDGYDVRYFESGSPSEYVEYTEGAVHGVVVQFHENHNVRFLAHAISNYFFGEAFVFDENGGVEASIVITNPQPMTWSLSPSTD